jgi:hypothetical protein
MATGFCVCLILAIGPVEGHAGQKTSPASPAPGGHIHLMNGSHFNQGIVAMDKKAPKSGTAPQGVKENTSLNFGQIKLQYKQQNPQ